MNQEELPKKEKTKDEEQKEQKDIDAKLAEKYRELIESDLSFEISKLEETVSGRRQPITQDEPDQDDLFDEFVFETLGEGKDKSAFIANQVKEKIKSIKNPEEKQK